MGTFRPTKQGKFTKKLKGTANRVEKQSNEMSDYWRNYRQGKYCQITVHLC